MTKEVEVPLKTAALLDQMVLPARSNMKPRKELLYANKETGTLVYHVFTSNSTLPYPTNHYYCWATFLIGNEDGFAESDVYLESEANFHLGEIIEDGETVTIQRYGQQTIHFGILVPVGNLILKKNDFKPYPPEVALTTQPVILTTPVTTVIPVSNKDGWWNCFLKWMGF